MNPLSSLSGIYSGSIAPPLNTSTSVTTPMFDSRTQTLPNGQGSFQTPVPAQQTAPVKPAPPAPPVKNTIFQPPAPPTPTPAWIDPATGQPYSPQDMANKIVGSLPKGGDIPTFAGNYLTQAPQTVDQLHSIATALNNARNDIATGTTDPYKVGNQSGYAYSPAELDAIQKAYAGIYDPAINTAISKLDTVQKAQTATADRIATTNENIRQYWATTGADKAAGQSFTNTQINKGASNAGMDSSSFKALDPQIQNFYINSPNGTDPSTSKAAPMYKIFANDLSDIASGKQNADDVTALITGSSVPNYVKQYFINQIPAAPAKKAGWLDGLWNWIKGIGASSDTGASADTSTG